MNGKNLAKVRKVSGQPKDPRSTGRKRGRRALLEAGITYQCKTCGYGPLFLPETVLRQFPDTPLPHQSLRRANLTLQVQHKNKNILDNDLANLKWLCPSCHKLEDQQTGVGESTVEDEWGY